MRLGTIIGLLKFKLKTILGYLVLRRVVSYNIIGGSFRWQGFKAPDTGYHLSRTEIG